NAAQPDGADGDPEPRPGGAATSSAAERGAAEVVGEDGVGDESREGVGVGRCLCHAPIVPLRKQKTQKTRNVNGRGMRSGYVSRLLASPRQHAHRALTVAASGSAQSFASAL